MLTVAPDKDPSFLLGESVILSVNCRCSLWGATSRMEERRKWKTITHFDKGFGWSES